MAQTDDLLTRLHQPVSSLQEIFVLGQDSISSIMSDIKMMPVVSAQYQHYILPFSLQSNKYLRPINQNLFIDDVKEIILYQKQIKDLIAYVKKTKGDLTTSPPELKQLIEKKLITKTIYTTLQSIGCALDKLTTEQESRKNFGQRYEDFIKLTLSELGIANKSFTFKTRIPVINVTYRAPFDVILNPNGIIHSSPSKFDSRDIILSSKTSSKDRMKLIFVDRFVLKNI